MLVDHFPMSICGLLFEVCELHPAASCFVDTQTNNEESQQPVHNFLEHPEGHTIAGIKEGLKELTSAKKKKKNNNKKKTITNKKQNKKSSQELVPAPAPAAATTTKSKATKTVRTSRRTPMGFSFKLSADGPKGKDPECKGCGDKIGKETARIVHKHFRESNHKFETIHQFHCNAGCVHDGLRRKDLEMLMQKRWTEPQMRGVVERLQQTVVTPK